MLDVVTAEVAAASVDAELMATAAAAACSEEEGTYQ
jgi:hypothetical protein